MTFMENFSQLFNAVTEPVWARIRSMTWLGQASVLAVLTILIAVWQLPSLRNAAYDQIAGMVSKSDVDVSKHSNVPNIEQLRAGIGQIVKTETLSGNISLQTSWSLSQAIIPIKMNGSGAIANQAALIAEIMATKRTDRFCWPVLLHDASGPCALFISGWVMKAFASMGEGISGSEIDSLLVMQSSDGSWPTFEGTSSDRFQSTYATSWILLGLHDLRKANLIPADRVEAVDKAILSGSLWLYQNREVNARWKPYPNWQKATVSVSISGLAIHTLNTIKLQDISGLNEQWLNSLPDNGKIENNNEQPYIEIPTSRGLGIDQFVYFRIPWMVIATVDTLNTVDGEGRQKGRNFINSILKADEILVAEKHEWAFWRSELLYSLEYLNANYDSGIR
jgi:hypothetical protein